MLLVTRDTYVDSVGFCHGERNECRHVDHYYWGWAVVEAGRRQGEDDDCREFRRDSFKAALFILSLLTFHLLDQASDLSCMS
jgi:hypothetical protein